MQIPLIRKATSFKISQYNTLNVSFLIFVLVFTVRYKIWKLGRVGHAKREIFLGVKPSCFYGSASGVSSETETVTR